MRPLERSLEKLDDVRRKKLNEMIGGMGSGPPAGGSSGWSFILNMYSFDIRCPCLLTSDFDNHISVNVQTSSGVASEVRIVIFCCPSLLY